MFFVEYVIYTPFSYYVLDGIYTCLCSRKYIMYTLKFNLFALTVYAGGNIYIEFCSVDRYALQFLQFHNA